MSNNHWMSPARTTFIPYMCDHSYLMQATMESFGLPAEVLPPPDDEVAQLGMDLVLGRECTPCLLVAGDIIRRFSQPGFDPSRAAVLMPTAAGPCRFGQYNVLMRHVLDEHGFQAVDILSPSAENSYLGFGDRPGALRRRAWQGIVALDLLQALLHRFRPYGVDPHAADAIYQEGLQQLLAALRRQGKSIHRIVQWCGGELAALPQAPQEPRPLIGLIGEIYLRFNGYANQRLVHMVEQLGGEVILATMMEWLYYTNWWYSYKARARRNYRALLITSVSDLYQRMVEVRLARPVRRHLRHPLETRTSVLMRGIEPYFEPAISTEAVLTLGKAIDLAKHGASGILNVMPFSCMPGIVAAGLAPRLRQDLDHIPWLDVSYDLQKTTNIQTRLEAFMYQATHFQHHRNAASQPATTPV